MKHSINMLLTCILYCDAGPGCLITTVRKFSMLLLIANIIFIFVRFFFGDFRSFTSGKLSGEAKKGRETEKRTALFKISSSGLLLKYR